MPVPGTTAPEPKPAKFDWIIETINATGYWGIFLLMLRQPDTRDQLIRLAAEMRYPAVVKPQVGNSAKGVAVVETPEAAIAEACIRLLLQQVGEAAPLDGDRGELPHPLRDRPRADRPGGLRLGAAAAGPARGHDPGQGSCPRDAAA